LQRDALSQIKKKNEKERKRAFAQVVKSWWAPEKTWLAMVCGRKGWEECQSFEKAKKKETTS
jgi:hypothetical protein